VELTAPLFNKLAAGSFLALAALELCLLPLAGRGGEERKRLALVAVGSGRRGSSLASVRVAGGRPSPSSHPSAPLPAGRGGEGMWAVVRSRVAYSLFRERSLRSCSGGCCCCAPPHLAGRGGREVSLGGAASTKVGGVGGGGGSGSLRRFGFMR
jgi:hypothetical protein